MRKEFEDWLNIVEVALRKGLDIIPRDARKEEIIQAGAEIDRVTDIILMILANKDEPIDRMRVISRNKGKIVSYRVTCPLCKTILEGTFHDVVLIQSATEPMVRYYCPICDEYILTTKNEFKMNKRSTYEK